MVGEHSIVDREGEEVGGKGAVCVEADGGLWSVERLEMGDMQ